MDKKTGQESNMTCPVCRTQIERDEVGRARTYCSDRCKQKAYRKRRDIQTAYPFS